MESRAFAPGGQTTCCGSELARDSSFTTGPRFTDPAATAFETLQTINARLALMDGVAAAKWQSGAPVLDAAREQQVLDQVVRLASDYGLEPDTTRAVFTLQMRLAREWQERRRAAWREHGGLPAGTSMPDLAKQIRPQLDAITTTQLNLFARDHADWNAATVLRTAYAAHQPA